MNQIRSPRAGTVSKIFVANGAPVEYGEPMLVDRLAPGAGPARHV